MKRVFCFAYFFYLFFLPFQLIQAQNVKFGIPDIEHFNRRQYGAGTQNWQITQGNNDLLYVANNEGVIEYDGVNWRLMRDMGNYIVRSVKSIGNRIYAGSYNEIGYFEYDSLHHLNYNSLSVYPELQNNGDYWNIHDWNGTTVFHAEKAICLFKNDEVTAVIPAVSRFVSTFLVNGLLLVHDETEGLMEVRGDQIYKVSGGDQFAGQMIGAILSLSSTQMVIGSMDEGLFLWDMQSIKPWKVPASALLKKTNVFCGINYRDDQMVFGTIQSGLVVCNKLGQVVTVIDKDKGLMNNTVLSVFSDREGNIWGGMDNGMVRVAFNSSVSFVQGYYNIGTGYVMDLHKGKYYFGTNQALYRTSQDEFSNPLMDRDDFEKIAGTEGQVWTLFKDGDYLLCGHNKGVFELRNGRSQLITPSVVDGVWLFKRIKDHPNLLVAGTYHGLILLEKKSGGWKFVKEMAGFSESSRFLEWDTDGSLWMSHGYKGIYKIHFTNDYSEISQVDTFSLKRFPGSPEALIVSQINGESVFTARKGLYTYNESTRLFIKDTRFDAFFSPGHYPLRVKEDAYRNIWCFHAGQVNVLRYQEDGSYKKIDYPFIALENKLVNGFEFIYAADKEHAFFGIEDGFAYYAVDDQKNYKRPFNVHIRSFKGQTDTLAYSLSQDGDEATTQLIIPEYKYQQNAFEIQFAATYFEDHEVSYSTFLSSVDHQPTPWSKSTIRQFTKLSEGNYEFKVVARNRYGVESKPITFKFAVLPPWYRSAYAKLMYGVVLFFLTLLVVWLFNRRVEVYRQREKTKQQERYKVREERLKNEALTAEKEMIRMRNEKLRNDMIHKEKELANSTMSIIQKNEFLTSIKEYLTKIKRLDDKKDVEQKVNSLIRKIDKDIDSEQYWEVFETHLEQVHEAFLSRLQEKHPDLSGREQKLCAYIRMGMASKEIATLMNISARAVENNRYRLRQKLNLEQGDNLAGYISQL